MPLLFLSALDEQRFLDAILLELEEASLLVGCRQWTAFWRICAAFVAA